MNPNATLEEIRRIITLNNRVADLDRLGEPVADALLEDIDLDRLSELVEALDGWVSKGGALPDDWATKQDAAIDRGVGYARGFWDALDADNGARKDALSDLIAVKIDSGVNVDPEIEFQAAEEEWERLQNPGGA